MAGSRQGAEDRLQASIFDVQRNNVKSFLQSELKDLFLQDIRIFRFELPLVRAGSGVANDTGQGRPFHFVQVFPELNGDRGAIRSLPDLLERIVGHHMSLMDDDHPLADRFHLGEDMGGEEDGLILSLLTNDLPDLEDLVRVETGGGFVEDQHVGVVEEGGGQTHALFVSFGQGADPLVGLPRQTHHSDHFLDAGAERSQVMRLADELQVLPYIEVVIKWIQFGEISDFFSDLERVVGHVVAAYLNRTGVGRQVSGDHFEGGGFACAVGAQEAYDLSAVHLKGDPVHRCLGAKAFREGVEADGHMANLPKGMDYSKTCCSRG